MSIVAYGEETKDAITVQIQVIMSVKKRCMCSLKSSPRNGSVTKGLDPYLSLILLSTAFSNRAFSDYAQTGEREQEVKVQTTDHTRRAYQPQMDSHGCLAL